MNRKLFIVYSSLFAGLVLFLYKSYAPRPLSQTIQEVFVVGTASGYAPFVSVNEYGDYEGLDIDIARELAREIGKKLIIKDLGSMAPLFIALDQGSIDAIIWGLSITQDRLQHVAMVHYQGERTDSYPLLFWGPVPENVHSLTDLSGKTVCAEPASAQEVVLKKYPEINLLPVEKIDDALLAIQYSKADAALVEPAIAKKFKKKYPEIQELPITLEVEDRVQGIGIALSKNNKKLEQEVSAAVTRLKQSGVIKELEEKWGLA